MSRIAKNNPSFYLFSRFIQFLVTYTHVQLFVFIYTLPFIIAWGIPFSLFSYLGNLFFTPILTLFLCCSSLIFFSELFGMPNKLCYAALEIITNIWISLLKQLSKNSGMVGLPKNSFYPLVCLFCFIGIVSMTYALRRQMVSIALGFVVATSIFFLCHRCKQKHFRVDTIGCNGGTLFVFNDLKKVVVIDPGFIGRKTNAVSWVTYTLMPDIIRKTGRTFIDHIIFLQPSIFGFQALHHLCDNHQVKQCTIIWWEGKAKKHLLKTIRSLNKQTYDHIQFVRLKKKCYIFNVGSSVVFIDRLDQYIRDERVRYPVYTVSCSVDNSMLTIYPAKHKKYQTTTEQVSVMLNQT